MQINFKFHTEALSSNRAYKNLRHGRALTQEAKHFKKMIYLESKNQLILPKFNIDEVWIEATYYFYSPKILKKNGTINQNKLDVSSCVKLLQDSIFEAMDFDDVFITQYQCKQMQAEKPFIFVNYNIWPLRTLNEVDV